MKKNALLLSLTLIFSFFPAVKARSQSAQRIEAGENSAELTQLLTRQPAFAYGDSELFIVCPIRVKKRGINLLIFSTYSSSVDGQPSAECERWVEERQELATLKLLQATLPNREDVIEKVASRLAQKLGLSSTEFSAMLIDDRTLKDLDPVQRYEKILRLKENQLNSLSNPSSPVILSK